ncbi:hypothetical protein C9374_008648 [Naegleria lovaniensis]|uniref:F-box domain-containing protein n=1 Tax=Naegleria lovaniensis TaxID=51637 RepID=A0AA88KHB8_NAELO|nr:uncharacterized protein C9374_008648 [Naegleria lovaniensis]KAG2378026.1 hypothetical protein C9374_008648 [Naegleria lovaniensis]
MAAQPIALIDLTDFYANTFTSHDDLGWTLFNQELPDDMVFHILQFLESEFIIRVCMKVSTQWYRKSLEIPLSLNFSNWTSRIIADSNMMEQQISVALDQQTLDDTTLTTTTCSTDSSNIENERNINTSLTTTSESSHSSLKDEILSMDQYILLFSNCPNLKNLTSLNVSNCKLKTETLQALLTSENVWNLSYLNLSDNDINMDIATTISKYGRHFKQLTHLNLANCGFKPKTLKLIMHSPFVRNVKSIQLTGNTTVKKIAKILSTSKCQEQLVELNIGRICIYSEGVKRIIETLNHIQSLNLHSCYIRDQGLKILASSPQLKHLTLLNCDGNLISDEGVKAIATSDYMKNLKTLELESNTIGNEGVEYIASSPFMTNLTFLNLQSNYRITEMGLKTLIQSDKLKNLIQLHVPAQGKDVLMIDSTLSQLPKLDLSKCSFSTSAFYNAAYKCYNGGDGILQDYSKAFKYFELSALKEGDRDAYYFLGMMSLRGNVKPQNTTKGIEYLEQASKLGDVDAVLELGQLYVSGVLVPQDSQKAFQYFEKAARDHNASALIKLAYIYYLGNGTRQNLKKAHEYYELAAKQNAPVAYLSLGFLYFNGLGVERNERQALEYYELAAKQRHDLTLTKLGVMYLKGQHVPLNLQQSVQQPLSLQQSVQQQQQQQGLINHGDESCFRTSSTSSSSDIDSGTNNKDQYATSGGSSFNNNSSTTGQYSVTDHGSSDVDSSLHENCVSPQLKERGLAYLRECASRRYTCALRELAFMYLFGLYGMERNDKHAMNYLLEGVNKHDKEVLMLLGLMYYCGYSGLKYVHKEENGENGEENREYNDDTIGRSSNSSSSGILNTINNSNNSTDSRIVLDNTNCSVEKEHSHHSTRHDPQLASITHCVKYLKLAHVLDHEEIQESTTRKDLKVLLQHALTQPSKMIHYNSECTSCRRLAFTGRFRYSCNNCLQYILCENCYHSNKNGARDGHFHGMNHHFIEEQAPIHVMCKFLHLFEESEKL